MKEEYVGKGVTGMEREVLVSGEDAVRVIALDEAREKRRVPLEEAGALCVAKEQIFCACGKAIWKLDKETLMPQTLFGCGPGVCDLQLSMDEKRLYALCGEADSVLMMDGRTGEPMLLHAAGVNPRQIALDADVLAIAGGESGYVFLLCAQSLRMLAGLPMPGPVYSVAIGGGNIHALCLTPSLSSVLVTQSRGEVRSMLVLSGMPGRLLVHQKKLLAATEDAIYTVSPDGTRILERLNMTGRASWLHAACGELLMLDAYSDSLVAFGREGRRTICSKARAAAYCGA